MRTYRLPRVSVLWLAAALAVVPGACTDRLPSAPGNTGGLRLQLRANTAGNTTDAFAKVNAAHVVLMQAAVAVLDTTVDFSGATSEIPLTVRLQNPSGTVALSVQLLAGAQALFQGSSQAALQRGVSTTVDVALSPIVTLVAPDSVLLTALGDTTRLGGAVVFATGDTLTGSQVTWTGGGAAASVSPTGLAIALAEGVTQATGTYQALTRTTRVRVAATVARVALSADTFSLSVGSTRTLTAAAFDRRGNQLSRTFAWQSANSSVASVSPNGVVTGVAPGKATITGSAGGQSATATVTVRLVPVASVVVSPASASVLPGSTLQLTATTYDAALNILTGRTVTWASSDTTVAKVSSTGLVTGVNYGGAFITATSEGVSGRSSITVGQPILTVSPSRLGFSAISAGGAPPTQTVLIDNAGTGILGGLTASVSYPPTGAGGWITTLSFSSTTAPATLTVGVDQSALSPGASYSATITVSSSGGTANITVFFTVTQPILAVSATSVTIPPSDTTTHTVQVTNAGSGTLDGITISNITYGCPVGVPSCPTGWLNANVGSTAPTTLTLQHGFGNFFTGMSATVTVTSSVPGAGSRQVTVTM